jgi:hypothetical protein
VENFSFKRILFLTILVSGVAFYGAVSVFASFTLRPVDERILPNGRLKYSLSKDYRDFAVRSIGLCILASVGMGLTTAEVVRRRNQARKKSKSVARSLSQAGLTASTEMESLETLQLQPSRPTSPSLSEMERSTDAFLDSLLRDGFQGLEFSQPEQICRIKVPQRQQSLFAILLDGQYYSFTRAEREPETALHLLNQQSQKGNSSVITRTCDRYVIWTWQPQAELHL